MSTENSTQPAQLSIRFLAALEIISVVFSVVITAWVLNPLQLRQRWIETIPGLLALTLIIYSHRIHHETPRTLGFTFAHFRRAWKLLILPMFIAGALLISLGYFAHSLNFGQRFWLSLLLLPLWGLIQQYILQAFIYRRLQMILPNQKKSLQIFLAALLFAFVHAPNFPLMFLTLVGGLVWTWVYERAPNLWVLGISHGVMSAIAMSSLPAWFLQTMSVGYKYLIYQRF